MSEKRRDSKGRILKTGESQRPNGSYMFRYRDNFGKTNWCYAPTLADLREQEQSIMRNLSEGINNDIPYLNVLDLVDQYIEQHIGVREGTKDNFKYVRNRIAREEFGTRKVESIKQSDAKAFMIHLHIDGGLAYGTITSYLNVLKPAFEMAVQDDYIRRNPFRFGLNTVLENDACEKYPLTDEQKTALLEFIASSKRRSRHYDEVLVLLETGIRISEMCGLTIENVDMENRRIRICQQLLKTDSCKLYIQRPKTNNGVRMIPLTDKAYEAFERVLTKRKETQCVKEVEGCSSFVFLSRDHGPRTSDQFRASLRRIIKRYNESHDAQLPRITPHTFRHTFVSDMNDYGLDPKSLQIIAGHSDIRTTMNVYTHVSYEKVRDRFIDAVTRKT